MLPDFDLSSITAYLRKLDDSQALCEERIYFLRRLLSIYERHSERIEQNKQEFDVLMLRLAEAEQLYGS